MIRMGRSNPKTETAAQPEPTNLDNNKPPQSFGLTPTTNESAAFRPLAETNGNRAFTESEGLARDIKEGRLSGYVGAGTTQMGETEFKSLLRVDGHLVGKVASADGTLHVGASGQVDANVRVASAVIYGAVNGDVFARERIEIGRTGKVVGNIQAPVLVVEQGAILEGNCSMMKPKAEADKRAAQATAETREAEKESIAANSKIDARTRINAAEEATSAAD